MRERAHRKLGPGYARSKAKGNEFVGRDPQLIGYLADYVQRRECLTGEVD